MATLFLTAAASSFGLSGFSLFAATLAATAVGGFIDNRLFGAGNQNVQQEGPRLTEIHISTGTEGQPIKRLFGRSRIGGNMIWTTDFREVQTTTTETQGGGGKGGIVGGGRGGGTTVTTTTYNYYISCAFAFTEGNSRATLGRLWADNKLLDTNGIVYRFYPGSDTQGKDPKIVAVEGDENTTAYRGVAYLVFEDLRLSEFGNRIPQFTAEIIVPIDDEDAEIMENLIESINLIPASGEVIYGTTPQIKDDGYGNAVAENVHLKADETDFELSIQDLLSNVRNAQNISLVVAWLGTDIRMSYCDLEPRVEVQQNKVLQPTEWSVSGTTRLQANESSQINVNGEMRPAFGGTPSDHSVIEAIQYMCDEKELNVAFYPFILMDVPSGNGLPDPYGGSEQGAYPWRGHITLSDPDLDKTSTAQTEIDSFFGFADAADFSVSGTTVTYIGSAGDKGYRRMILHYAHLFATAANSLDDPTRCTVFYVGSEMRGITQTRREGLGVYPGVTAMSELMDDVRDLFDDAGLSHVKLSYASDWSEYNSHRPTDGSNDVFFNLDPLWVNPNCDFIAIDNYLPISDWRDGVTHADYGTGNDIYGNPRATTIYDLNYLKGQMEGGVYYDYYYANDSDRAAQIRTPIVDGAVGEHWIYRQKDIRSWWSNEHMDRPNGVRGNLTPGQPSANYFITNGSQTASFATDDRGNPATRVQHTAPASSWYQKSYTTLIPGNTYAIRIRAKSNTGSSQTTSLNYFDGTHHRLPITLTTSWQDFSLVFTAATATINVYPSDPRGGGTATDILISIAGLESEEGLAGPTDWTAGLKKIVFSEYGCPAVDKGTNEPNVFFDPKSSQSRYPYFSSGQRDDTIQRAYIEANILYWRDNAPTIGAVKMLDPTDMFVWTWDARPYPAFPYRTDFWSDGANWTLGHWLTGRVGVVPLGELVRLICGWVGFTDNDIDTTGLVGTNTIVRGYPIDSIMSPREALNPLFSAYLFDGFESQGKIKFLLRANTPFSPVDVEDFVSSTDNPSGYQINRAQETELPSRAILSYYDEEKDYQVGTIGAQRQTTTSSVVNEVRFPLVLPESVVGILSEVVIQESWAARERLEFSLSPRSIALDPGDGVIVTIGGRQLAFRLTGIQKGDTLEMNAEGIDTTIYDALVSGAGANNNSGITVAGRSVLHFLDLPLVTGQEERPWAPRIAAYQSPFPPAVNIYEDTGSDTILTNQLYQPAQMGVLVTDLPAGPRHIIDEGNILQIDMNDKNYQVLSDTEFNVRNGSNAIAVQTTSGEWEIMKFVESQLQFGRRYNLRRLFRGQLGSWSIMEDPIPAGQPVVFLNVATIGALNIPESRKFDEIDWRYGPNVYAVGSPFYQNYTHTGRAVGQLPYPVANVQFYPGDGEVRLEWVRQTRFGGEGFEEAEVPLNEDYEKYEIDLLDVSDVLLSTVEVTSPSYVFVGAPSVFKAVIYQMSASVGRGRPVTAVYGA